MAKADSESKRYTYSPCQICKQRVRRVQGELCPVCQYQIEQLRSDNARMKALLDGGQPYKVGERPQHLYYSHPGDSSLGSRRERADHTMSELLHKLILALTIRSAERQVSGRPDIPRLIPNPHGISIWEEENLVVWLRSDVANTLRDLAVAMQGALKQYYITGREHGEALLTRLAKDEVTISDYNRLTTRREDV